MENNSIETDQLTHEEHRARAMLMGMEYYYGTGYPVYIKRRSDGSPDIGSMIDGRTLKSVFDDEDPDREHIVEHARKLVVDMHNNKRYGKGWVK